jgi:hypothetical protein
MKRFLLNKQVVAGSIALAGIMIMVLFAWIWFSRPVAASPSSAVVTLIPGPTSTPLIPPTATISLLPVPTATALPNQIAIGGYVKIDGTEGQGLRLRNAPGLQSNLLFLGNDSEVFKVKDGPVQADDLTWWYLEAPYDVTRTGWAAATYLSVVSSP